MAALDMRTYMEELRAGGDLAVIDAPVTVQREIGALVYESTDRALLFTNVRDHPGWRVLGQAPANLSHFAKAFGVGLDQLLHRYRERLQGEPIPWRVVGDAPVKDVIHRGDDADVLSLPANVVWRGDAGRYIAASLCIVRDPDTGIQNMAWHRVQLKGPRRTGILARTETHLWQIYQRYERRGEPMPIAIVNGHHPLVYLAGAFSGDMDVDELALAGTLMGEPLRMTRCETSDICVPADAEVVVEGVVLPGVREPEGPFGEFHGYATSAAGNNPVIQVNAITHRRDPVFKTVVNFTGREGNYYTALNISLAIYERLRTVAGGLDIRNVVVSGDLYTVVVQMAPRFHGDAKLALMQALVGPVLHPKVAIAVDEDVNPFDPAEVMWSVSTRMNPARDLFVLDGVRGHPMDQTFDLVGSPGQANWHRIGSKVGLDATKPPSLAAPEERSQFTLDRPPGWGEVHLSDYLPPR